MVWRINNFNVYDCDLVNGVIAPNFGNIQSQNNPLVAWLPADYDPGYGDGFYQGHETDTNTCHLGGLTWLTVPAVNRTYAQQGTTTGSGWTNSSVYGGAYGVQDSTNGDALAMTITTNGGPIYEWYLMNGSNGGTFSWQLDSTITGSVAVQGQDAFTYPISSASTTLGAVRIPVTTGAGSHTITSTITSTTTSANNVTLIGLGTPSGVPYHGSSPVVYLGGQVLPTTNGPQPNAVAAFNADQKNLANQLFSDGLSVNFVDVQAYLKPTDYNSNTQLNSSGFGHIASAFSAAMQYHKDNSLAVSPLDYGAACNTKLFIGNNFNGGGNNATLFTPGSNVISIQGYTFQPGVATQNGGGDVGKVISIFSGTDVGPTTYIASVTTSTNTATLGALSATTTSTTSYTTLTLMGGYPANPNDPSTAKDDTIAIQNASVAAASGGGRVVLPNNCMVHNLALANNTELVGNQTATNYASSYPGDFSATTKLYAGFTGYSDDVDGTTPRNLGIDITNSANVALRNFNIVAPTFPYLGFTGLSSACIGTRTQPSGSSINANWAKIENVTFNGCPVGLGSPFGWNQTVTATGTISGTTMTIDAITSTNLSAYGTNLSAQDFLGVGRKITGTGVTANTVITAAPPGGQLGTYTVNLASTTSTDITLTSSPLFGYFTGEFNNNQFMPNGIGINGDTTDATFQGNTFTTYNYGIWNGPSTSSYGSGANHILGGRFESSQSGFVCDSCSGTQLTGVQFQGVGGTSGGACGNAIIMRGAWSDVLVTGGWFDGNGSVCSGANDKSQILIGGSGHDFTVTGAAFVEHSPADGNSNYLLETATGATIDYIAILDSQGTRAGQGAAIGVYSPANGGPPAHYTQRNQGTNQVDNTVTVLSSSSTGGVGIGTATPTNGTSLDLLSETATTNSSIGLPNHTTTNRPTGVTGMFGLNTTTSALEFYDQSNWNILPSTTTIAPGPNYSLVSTTTGGDEGQWSLTGTITSGTAGQVAYYAATGQQVSGSSVLSQTATGEVIAGSLTLTATTGVPAAGIYLPSANTLALAASTTELAAVTTGGLNILVGGIAFAGNLTVALPNSDTTSVLLGLNALASQSASTGDNTGIGSLALNALTTGTKDLAIGYKAGQKITVGGSNVVIGPLVASTTLTIGSNNILIGTTSALDTSTSSTSNALNIGNLYEGDTSINHPYINGTVPTISSGAGDFGTAPSIVGNDVVGKVVIGSSPGGQGTVTFANPWTNAPDSCSCNNNTTTARGCSALAITTTSFALGATTSPFTGADQLGYECKSHRL